MPSIERLLSPPVMSYDKKPAPYTNCTTDKPPNPLAATNPDPAFTPADPLQNSAITRYDPSSKTFSESDSSDCAHTGTTASYNEQKDRKEASEESAERTNPEMQKKLDSIVFMHNNTSSY
jgi:hypothetical protein